MSPAGGGAYSSRNRGRTFEGVGVPTAAATHLNSEAAGDRDVPYLLSGQLSSLFDPGKI